MREFFPLPSEFRQVRLRSSGGWSVESVPLRELGPRDLLFELIAAGITERDAVPDPRGERIPAGIAVGEIAGVGDAVSGWSPLDRALILPPVGGPTTRLSGLGEFVLARDVDESDPASARLVKLPDHVPAEEATLLPAAAVAAHLLREAALPPGGRLLVVGLGLTGQILILLARHHRAEQIVAADPSATLRAKAEWCGATRVIRVPEEPLREIALAASGRRGFHAIAVLAPDPDLLGEASRVLAPQGSLLIGAEFPPGFTLTLAPAWIRNQEARIQGVAGFGERDLREAIRAVGQGIVNAESLVSKRIPWNELEGMTLDPSYWTHGTHVILEGPEP